MAEFVSSYRESQERIRVWSDGLLAGHETARRVTARTRNWFYSPAHDTFAPSKFIGYADVTLDDYNPRDLDGRETQGAIRRLGEYQSLTDDYLYSDAIRAALGALIHSQAGRLKKGAHIHVPKLNPLRRLMIALNFAQEYYSYKLVLLTAILEGEDAGAGSVQERIWSFYRARKTAGLLVEREGSTVLGFDLETFKHGEVNALANSAAKAINTAYGTGEVIIADNGTFRFAPVISELLPTRGDEFRYYLETRIRDYYENPNRQPGAAVTSPQARTTKRAGDLRADWLRALPDPQQRAQAARIMVEAIKRAHAIEPGCWMISYKPQVPYINLNIGRLFAFTVRPGKIDVLLDSTELDLATLPPTWGGHDGKKHFKVVPETTWRNGPTAEVLGRWASLEPGFQSAVAKAARTSKRPPWWRNHAPQMVEILREETGEDLPDADLPVEDTSSMGDLIELLEEFLASYPGSPDGQQHYHRALAARKQFLESFAKLKADRAGGKDITDDVLLKLLPYGGTSGNRARGAWVTTAPVITKDVKEWFEGAGWAKPGDWPAIAGLIMDFFVTCEADPAALADACQTFADKVPAKGFQAAMLSPGLSSLNPDAFCVINKKPLLVLKWYAGVRTTSNLLAYPEANRAVLELVEAAHETLAESDILDELHPTAQFDMFTHWLVAIRKPQPQGVRYWKIAPGEQAWNWETCRAEGVITMGWEKTGDLSSLTKEEFDSLASRLAEQEEGYSAAGMSQLWTFADDIHPGDRILANLGKSRVVGVGTVAGEYRYEPGIEHGHRLPVTWDPVEPFEVPTQGWQKTIVQLKKQKFEELLRMATTSGQSGKRVSTGTNYWLFQANPKIFNLERELQIDGNEALDCWRVTRYRDDLQEGDQVLLWQAGKKAGIYGIAEITAPAYLTSAEEADAFIKAGDYKVPIRITEVLETPITKATLQERTAFADFHILKQHMGTNFRVSEAEWHAIRELMKPQARTEPLVTLEAIADATGFDLPDLQRWVNAINRKGQGVLYGPPGTGKTFVASHLARHMIGGSDGFVDLIQFHPAYTYEDFIQGLRPEAAANGSLDYRLVPGRFLEFCRKARKRQGTCVLILDEINRANLARVFGELMYLMEYRDQTVPLAGGGELAIPWNVRIIGTMNTADRSIALVDHALRRRFAFIPLRPQYQVLEKFHQSNGYDAAKLTKVLQKLNQAIDDPHYEVGISYFMRGELGAHLEDIWRMEIEPYLEEYFFDQAAKAKEFRWSKIEGELS